MNWKENRRRIGIIIFLGLAFLYFNSLPKKLFEQPTSTVLEDRDGNLLGAQIAGDGQWRFPHNPDVPYKFAVAITQFEDRNFFEHSGLHLPSLFRAFRQNISEGRVVSGGSTLSMQVIRLSRQGQSRSLWEKAMELVLASRLELKYSKQEILAFYASNAPFGGNVVGLDAAAWRYFGRRADELSWSEASMLAVLPNAPSLIYPGKNQEKLLAKRNRLLDRLQTIGVLTELDCNLAKAEPLPGKPHPLPQLTPHLLTRALKAGKKGQRVITTIDPILQEQAIRVTEQHHRFLKQKHVYNAAAIIIEVETGNVLAYIGNTQNDGAEFGSDVDVITAPRSTGSILKPFLFAAMLQEGDILPGMLVPDVPTSMKGFAPKNFTLSYDGAVPARRALSRSLNVPAVHMLHDHGLEKFRRLLQRMKFRHINKSAEHYGLSLILGGAESSLWDIAGNYASMSRTLNHYNGIYGGKYDLGDFHEPNYLHSDDTTSYPPNLDEVSLVNAASIFLTYQALIEVNRPDNELGWEDYASSGKVAWKTGTSFGHRDAWAVGTTRDYVVGVWVGNADGEGRPGITGSSAAAPLMFDLFDLLPTSHWFATPYDDMEKVGVCHTSGHRALEVCEEVDSIWIPTKGLKTPPCPYHQLVHLESNGVYRTSSECTDVNRMVTKSWFVLPPVQEYYYKAKNPNYQVLPPYDPTCAAAALGATPMEMIYPKEDLQVLVPTEIDGEKGQAIFEVAHRKPNITVYWHIDNEYIGSTFGIHQMGLRPSVGEHILTLVDENGHTLEQRFEAIGN